MQREALEQEAVVSFCDLQDIPIYAIPNGGKRNAKEAHFMKLSGVKAGVPDLCIPLSRREAHGLYIEMKVKPNKPTDSQIRWIKTLEQNGYIAKVCYSAGEAIKLIKWYVGGANEQSTL